MVNALGPYGNKTDDKPFVHKYNGIYYLSWGCFYGMASSVYGPYTYQGVVIEPALLAPDFRIGNETSEPWYGREDYQDRHGSFFEAHGQWYYTCNDRSHSTDIGNEAYFRDTVIGYLHYNSNGTMAPVAINATGVGTYRASEVIQAENYFKLSRGVKRELKQAPNQFGVELSKATELVYPQVQLAGMKPTGIRVSYTSLEVEPQRLVFRNAKTEARLADCLLTSSAVGVTVDCGLLVDSLPGMLDVRVELASAGCVLLDWWRLV